MLKKITKLLLAIFIISTVFSPAIWRQVNADQISEEIANLQQDIASKQQNLEAAKQKQEELQKNINASQSQQVSLKQQLSLLNDNIAKTELEIQSTQLEIDKTALEIKKLTLEIRQKEDDIARQKDYLASVVRSLAQSDDVNSLEIILAHRSLSEFLSQVEYAKDLNASLEDVLSKVKEAKAELEKQNASLEKSKKNLEDYKKQLENKKAEIGDQKINKQYVLDKTRQSEAVYQSLLKKAKAEQENANAAIVAAEKKIRQKLAEQQGISGLQFSDSGFIWPVPRNVITAYFHDPDYPYRSIFEHPAIDIRAGQGTSIRAAASGYVAQAKDAGYGYSYIMIVHGDGLATVYGHVSRIDVKVDQFVAQGEVIGASGGMPGTRGAGYFTTGPHLHFEVRLNGIPVNPLSYLP